ncbi:MAG TPA: glycosyltransferase family 4 protein, partial [Acidimicrobiales bacterium]|nr:glycosyltransferase family 4 protein [Acidimicrobiales bacterium]
MSSAEARAKLGDIAAEAGLERILIVAWRDLDDPEAGGSELHAARVASLWAEAGIDVTMRTSAVPGRPEVVSRDGYRVVRRLGRYSVFPGVAAAEAARTARQVLRGPGRSAGPGPGCGLVEVWNGMPFFSPLWHRGPRSVWLHHVHGQMWRMVLSPPALGRMGEALERRVAPPLYRRTPVVTLSESARTEIVDLLRLPAANVSVVPPGVEARFTPGGSPAPHPLVLAVGRLVPVKHFDVLIDAAARLRASHAGLEVVIAGEGYERPALEARIRALGAGEWIRLPGRVGDDELVDLYRRAWVLAASSSHEGWGMTVTEAAACGVPAVVTSIPGHLDAVDDGRSGLLVNGAEGLERGLDE